MVVATVARLVEMKGVAYGIRAIACAYECGEDVVYHIVGDGPLRGELEALSHELGIADHIRFHGALPNDAVVALLAQTHVLLAPSVTAANGETEGIPNAVKEAMACGVPIVATRHSGIPELVEDGISGYLVPERDAPALAKRLLDLSRQPECWPAMGRAARAKIERDFDSNALSDALVELYERGAAAARSMP